VDEWLVKAVMAMYEGAQTVVRTTEGDSNAFNVKVGLHQGSVLSPLLFVIVMEMISRELRAGLPLELLYADDLILLAESEESLRDKIVKWKSGLEAKGLKMNTGKTKVMFRCSMKDKLEEKGKWPCGVCKGRRKRIYIAPLLKYLTLKALRYGSHSVSCKLHRTCLYLVSIHQTAHPRLRLRTSNCSLLLIYLPRKGERLSWPGWLVT